MTTDSVASVPLDPDHVRACEGAELAALESWMRAVPPRVAHEFGIGWERLGEALLVHANTDVLMFNRVLGLGALESRTERVLAAALERFSSLGVRRFMVQIAPGPWAEGLAATAREHGFYDHNYGIRLSRDASPPPAAPTDLTHAPMRPQDAMAFGAIRSEFRGRGAQSALIARRIEAALSAGCGQMVVETAADTAEKPNPSTHILRRFGFLDLYHRHNWVKLLAQEGTSEPGPGRADSRPELGADEEFGGGARIRTGV